MVFSRPLTAAARWSVGRSWLGCAAVTALTAAQWRWIQRRCLLYPLRIPPVQCLMTGWHEMWQLW